MELGRQFNLISQKKKILLQRSKDNFYFIFIFLIKFLFRYMCVNFWCFRDINVIITRPEVKTQFHPFPRVYRQIGPPCQWRRCWAEQRSRGAMSILPDELWSRILELGAKTSRLDYRDLCSIAIVSRRFSYLSSDPALWSILLALDFPQSSSSPSTLPPKSTYKIRFERDKARKVLLWRRAVLTAESQVAVSEKRLRELESLIVKEMERLKVVGDELSNLERARCGSPSFISWFITVFLCIGRSLFDAYIIFLTEFWWN